MEKKKTFIRICQLLCIVAFAGMALASSSAKSTMENIDGLVDGYQYGKSLWSDAEVEEQTEIAPKQEIASQEKKAGLPDDVSEDSK